ncbi:MAG: urea ABC transporter permease subunit UrtC [Litorilinea sp.]
MRKILDFARTWTVPILIFALLITAPLYLSDFRLTQLGRFVTFAIIALGLDLIWGYGGMLSLGQGLFFGLGAYGFAMYLKLQASSPQLPDFMFWSGLSELPWFWAPFTSPIFAIFAAILVPALLAALLGFLVFRSRVQGVYFSILTQALTLLMSIWFIGQQAYTGGTNGITNLGAAQIFGRPLMSAPVQLGFYLGGVIALALIYLLCRAITRSRFGRVLMAVRDNENRVRFLGYNPVTIKLIVFSLSAAIAAVAGILYVPQVGIISPSNMGVVPSIEMVIWVAAGGRGTLIGAVVGALAVSYGRSFLSESYPNIWQLFLGALFVLTVLVFPKGIVGTLQDGWARLTRAQTKLAETGAVTTASAAATVPTVPTVPTAASSEAAPANSMHAIQPSQVEGGS